MDDHGSALEEKPLEFVTSMANTGGSCDGQAVVPDGEQYRCWCSCGVVVTGGGGMLGRALALAFARRGADVVVADCDVEAAEAVAAEVRDRAGVRALALSVDVSDRASTDALAEATRRFSDVRVLCNN